MQATSSGQRHAGLTRLRFFLIGWVILYHLNLPLHVTDTWTWLGPVLWRGYLGVDGFFLLSGFALWLGYGTRPPRGVAGMGRFLLRRVAKIWPLHAVALLALALLVGLAMALGVTIREPERFGARDFVCNFSWCMAGRRRTASAGTTRPGRFRSNGRATSSSRWCWRRCCGCRGRRCRWSRCWGWPAWPG